MDRVFNKLSEMQLAKSNKRVQTIFKVSLTTISLDFLRNHSVRFGLKISIKLVFVEALSDFCQDNL